MSTQTLAPRIIKTHELFKKEGLTIPHYQRPYKWTAKNVHQLIDDIVLHRTKTAYRLGTIVFHRDEEGKLNVVDGQQRTITLLLIALAISNNNGNLRQELQKAKTPVIQSPWFNRLTFKHPVSLNNIRDNYREIERRVHDFNAETVQFFYDRCELVEVILTEVSEAFQFFDSQNSRGKDLEPHDLLKAFHLREMTGVSTEIERNESVSEWEGLETEKLKQVFGSYLFRIRNWSKGHSARHFTKDEVDVFKGVSPQVKEPFPFAALHRISHFYVDGYNREYHRNIDGNKMGYPFQIDQVIINGKRFFEMVNHYTGVLNQLKVQPNLSNQAKQIFDTLESYGARWRTGDKYIRNLFDCCLIYYIDKFGFSEVDRAIEKFFIWAYSLRLKMQNVQLASMDNYALEAPHMFKKIKEALHPSEVFTINLPLVEEVRASSVDEIKKLFQQMKYAHE
jgi:hypothetical protein